MVQRKDRTTKVIRKTRKKGPRKVVKTVRKKTNASHKCAVCGKELHGVAKPKTKANHSKKRVNRLHGGHLCHECSTKVVKYAARVKNKTQDMDSISFKLRRYVEALLSKL